MTTLVLSIKTAKGTQFEGEVESVSGINQVGPFDILSEHAQFVTPITGVLKWRLSGGKESSITFKQGLLHVKDDRVEIFGQEESAEASQTA